MTYKLNDFNIDCTWYRCRVNGKSLNKWSLAYFMENNFKKFYDLHMCLNYEEYSYNELYDMLIDHIDYIVEQHYCQNVPLSKFFLA